MSSSPAIPDRRAASGRRMGLVAAAAAAFLLAGCGAPAATHEPVAVTAAATASPTAATPAPSSSPTDTGEPLDPATPVPADGSAPHAEPAYATKAIDLLATLPVKGRAPKTGYSRAQFGQAWADVDHNGCDTRNDILARDLTNVVHTSSASCRVQSGTLTDRYTGKTIQFVRGDKTSLAVQIDHVVALGDAWQKGAQQLSVAQRTALANDPLNLLAVDGPTNEQKSDADAATWLPPNKSYRCSYVARQISVKATYGLWVTQAEHDAMVRVLSDCPGQQAPTNQSAPAPAAPAPAQQAPAPAPAQQAPAPAVPAPPAAPAPDATYYANCTAARAAGAAPLYRGQPGYRSGLDRDGDGVACEK